ncbi:MAG: carbonic anhydrase [Candidatus Omnitrophota bacterium]|jgi:hypothetical protein
MKYKFATAINCIDGRVQKPIIEFVINRFKVDYVDMVTEPGPDRVLSENKSTDIIESIKRCVSLSVERNSSTNIIIAGHHDCKANPVDKEEHCRQIKESVNKIKEWNLKIDVYGAWIGEDWKAVLL